MQQFRDIVTIVSIVLSGVVSVVLIFALLKHRQEQNSKDIDAMKGDNRLISAELKELTQELFNLVGMLGAMAKEQGQINLQVAATNKAVLEELKSLRDDCERHEVEIAVLKSKHGGKS